MSNRAMSNPAVAAGVGFARVMAHCGGDPAAAVHHLAGSIASAPENPEPYAVLAEWWKDKPPGLAEEAAQDADSLRAVLVRSYFCFLEGDMDEAALAIGSVTGVRPDIAWAKAPWFSDERFVGVVSADAMAEAAMRTMDYGHELDTDGARERFQPWFQAIDAVASRQPLPEALAKMAILLRACGLTDASFALCDRADSAERIMMTEVVRAGTWRKLGDAEQTVAAFERALALDPANWSLYLDLADVCAERGDFTAAVRMVEQGTRHGPTELALRAAGAAYRARLTGSPAELRELLALAPHLPNASYRDMLIETACAGPALPAELVAAARRIRNG
ncbi:tetratricopeptide repeat protein [Streptomyces antarcticus]|uniref:tetratricopeptide repeat protein n=1 Tax=Streptomyces antarcticus TaxID=2996458 RepID=UPI00226DC79C|nr:MULTISPECIES: tetratricopeptide repeat protein [unclassified Streptomyces]MCY0944088.1 tetratricopeptide repeat protein [Streptomyces sp. H34-AA3]MCZ4082196.1 tetratricopeptide repeat protein [Streptomyces sp. H34-S5]